MNKTKWKHLHIILRWITRPNTDSKTPGNDNVSIIIPRRLSAEFLKFTHGVYP